MKERKNKAEYSASDAPRTHLRESVPDGPMDGRTDGPTDGWTYPLIEMLGASKNGRKKERDEVEQKERKTQRGKQKERHGKTERQKGRQTGRKTERQKETDRNKGKGGQMIKRTKGPK